MKLLMTTANVIAIGLLTLGVIAPLLKDLPLVDDGNGGMIPDPGASRLDEINLVAAGIAIILHLLAHFFAGNIELEE